MARSLATIVPVVRDYAEAIVWYGGSLGFCLDEGNPILQQDKRWVAMSQAGRGAQLLPARAIGEYQPARIGDQAGGRIVLFPEMDEFNLDHAAMLKSGVKFNQAPRRESYGIVAVFEDLFGSRWDVPQ